MNPASSRILLGAAGLLLLAACDNAVRLHAHAPYLIEGDARGALYPLSVTRDSEDVHIELKNEAPPPEVYTVDHAGHATPYNFTLTGHTLVVPGKFERIQLRHAGAEPVAVVSVEAR